MPQYAHALIELPDGQRIERGETVPASVEGLDDLKDGGSVSSEKYDPAADKSAPPAVVEIEGVRYVAQTEDDDA